MTSDRADRVVNNGRIDVTATADVTRPKVLFDNTAKSAGQSGKGSSGAPGIVAQGVNIPTRSEAFATGIDAGICGLDEITNTGKLYATSSATTRVSSIELNLADSSKVNASVSAFSSATGILGAGSVTNTGWIIVTAGSEANTANIQGTIGKDAEANVSTSAESVAQGIAGSAGADTLITSGILSADATSLAEGRLNLEQSQSNVTLNASVTATATSTGIDGGAGADTIGNTSSLTVSSTSTARAPTIGKDAFASGVTDATVSSVAEATAMKGGSGSRHADQQQDRFRDLDGGGGPAVLHGLHHRVPPGHGPEGWGDLAGDRDGHRRRRAERHHHQHRHRVGLRHGDHRDGQHPRDPRGGRHLLHAHLGVGRIRRHRRRPRLGHDHERGDRHVHRQGRGHGDRRLRLRRAAGGRHRRRMPRSTRRQRPAA